MDKKYRYKISKIFTRILLHTFLSLGGLVMVFPFVWMILSSFKPSAEVISIPFTIFPNTWTLGNYIKALNELPMIRGYINSLTVSSVITFFVLFSSSSAGYLFAKLKFKGKENLFLLVLASIMIPPQIVLVPLYYMIARLHLVNSYIGLIALWPTKQLRSLSKIPPVETTSMFSFLINKLGIKLEFVTITIFLNFDSDNSFAK